MQLPISQLIHALLFTSGETWRFSELQTSLNITLDQLQEGITELDQSLEHTPLLALVHNDSITLVTKPEYKDFLQSLEQAEQIKEFSKGAIETLALIAYRGPIQKSDIDYIRGVNSQFMLRNLVMRGMVEKQSGKERGGYVITANALQFLGITDQSQLPQFSEFYQEIEKRIPVEDADQTN